MAARPALGTIVTFYSWKGGVGRTMALANIAVQLSQKGSRVLMVDWDLEAPGLLNYFETGEVQKSGKVSAAPAQDAGGLMALLANAYRCEPGAIIEISWRDKLRAISIPPDTPNCANPRPPTPGRLDLLPSGYGNENYSNRASCKTVGRGVWETFMR
jgi:hypothetical protein